MSRFRPQTVVLVAILAAQALLAWVFSITDEPLLALAMLGASLGSAPMLLDEARGRRKPCAADDAARRG